MDSHPGISFDNTEIAFSHKTDRDLKASRWLFVLMGKQWLVNLGIKLTPWTLKIGLPVNGIIRKTIFKQFVGGESLEQTKPVVQKLASSNVKVILDYGVEGKDGEENFEIVTRQFIQVIEYAATQKTIPFISIKITGICRFGFLEKMNTLMLNRQGSLLKRFAGALTELNQREKQEWSSLHDRISMICKKAMEKHIGVFVDAEESWIQEPIDGVTMLIMEQINREHPVVYNTLQIYRHDRLVFLEDCYRWSRQTNFILAIKIVRGAYMEKERMRAEKMNYPSPIQPDKESTDRDFNLAVKYGIDHLDSVAVAVATHNEYSNLYTTQLLKEKNLSLSHPFVHFSQLYGMSDNITFNLAKAGCDVSKYVPFGPIKEVIPYLMRRAQENTSVSGQTSRELALLENELNRRKASS